MNRLQRIILIVYVVAIFISCIYVPWDLLVIDEGASARIPAGYGLLWGERVDFHSQTNVAFGALFNNQIAVSIERWLVQIVGLTLIAAGLLAVFSDKKHLTE
ncbi:MAG: hypothetical protein KKG33_01040 [candidate division Zixibacteria bacterium]|nr:hypothetical protein [candidate division Zixibacteria bacterium]MBU1470654.1 hypothetical protein [candidate division Zixibacteria bacterium]MBU2624125.1 hypothetical protein [candidate division Zixibacteria bacterium]